MFSVLLRYNFQYLCSFVCRCTIPTGFITVTVIILGRILPIKMQVSGIDQSSLRGVSRATVLIFQGQDSGTKRQDLSCAGIKARFMSHGCFAFSLPPVPHRLLLSLNYIPFSLFFYISKSLDFDMMPKKSLLLFIIKPFYVCLIWLSNQRHVL